MNVPNLLTLLRILLIPVFIIFIMYRRFSLALITFAVAGITDGLDGLIARLTHQKTELGAYLDPIADKLLLTSSFIMLAVVQMLPRWLVVIVISRDVIILMGFCIFILTNKRPRIRPTFVSKMTTTFQILTILLVLVTGFNPTFKTLSTIAIYGTTVFTILSGVHYLYVGTRILNGKEC